MLLVPGAHFEERGSGEHHYGTCQASGDGGVGEWDAPSPSNPSSTSWVGPGCLEHRPDKPGWPDLSSRPGRVPLVACPSIFTCQLAGS